MRRPGSRVLAAHVGALFSGRTSTRLALTWTVIIAAVWAVVAALLPSGLPLGTVILGATTGALSGLTAIGLVILYRSTRIINFAQAEFGAVAATFAVLLVTRSGMNYFLAVGLGLVLAVALGGLVEVLIVRRFFQAPRLILTVATIGLAQVLGALTLVLPSLIKAPDSTGFSSTQSFSTPFHLAVTIDPIFFNGNYLVAVIACPLVVLGLVWFFNRTDSGIAIRAAADSQQRAQLLGIPVRRLSFIAWSIAAGLSALAAVLTAGVQGYSVTGIGGPSALLAPLAAAVVARFESLTVAFLASIGIGIFAQGMFWSYPKSALVDVALLGLILLALLLGKRQATRVTGEELGGFVAVQEVRPIPEALKKLPEILVARAGAVSAVAAVALGLPIMVSNSSVALLTFMLIYAMVAVSLVILTGWAGQMSLGQFAFVGLGAATTGSLFANLHVDLFLCLGASMAVGAVSAALLGLPALRIPGLFLAPVTLGFAVAVSSFALNTQYFPSFVPTHILRPVLFGRFDLAEPRKFYYFCLLALGFTLFMATNLRRSRAGRVLISVRDNERMASAFSISPMRAKLMGFAISGAIAGLAGGLYVFATYGVPLGGFTPVLSLQAFTMVVLGGLASISGGVLGAVSVQSAQYFLSGSLQLLVTGAGVLFVLLVAPGGLAELTFRLRDRWLRWVARRHGLLFDALPGSDDQEQPSASFERVGPSSADAPTHIGSLLELENLEASYGHMQVLFGMDLSVRHREVVALLGTNGAGKSTMLKVVAGILPTGGGRLIFDSEDISELSTIDRVRKGLVMVPEKGIFGSLTVQENLRVGAWLARSGGDRDFLDSAVPMVFELFPVLDARKDQKASLLSGGEQQMLAIAMGLLCKPKLLMVDELSLGLAPTLVASIVDVIHKLNQTGMTALIVEQSLSRSTSIASRAYFIEKGQVRFSGAASDLVSSDLLRAVFAHPKDARVAAVSQRRPAAATTPHGKPSAGHRVVLAAEGISKSYGAVAAVSQLNLEVRSGQILGIIGANGAGKTTAFDILSGFVRPDTGTIRLGDEDVTDATAPQRFALGLGRTFQDVRMVPSLTVNEMLAVSLERGVSVRGAIPAMLDAPPAVQSERWIRQRVSELIEQFGFQSHRTTFVHELSTGMRRILELACVTGHNPHILLLDEPSSGLAQAEAEAMAEQLREFRAASGATLVIIEHDVPLVSALSDEMVCMHLGTVIARGTPAQIAADPLVIEAYLGTDTHSADGVKRDREKPREPARAGS
jgi:branched-chain amino acid transport system permease protein